MPLPEPRYLADTLIALYVLATVFGARRAGPENVGPRLRSTLRDRGTSAVLAGCYVLGVLAVNGLVAPSAVVLPAVLQWTGVLVAAAGLTLWWCVGRRLAASGRRRRAHALAAYGGNLALWCGATMASGHLIATITIAVAMVAAYAVRLESDAAAGTGAEGLRQGLGTRE